MRRDVQRIGLWMYRQAIRLGLLCPAALRAYRAEPRELTRFFADRGYGAFGMARSGMLEPSDLENPPDELPGFEYMDILFTKDFSRAAT